MPITVFKANKKFVVNNYLKHFLTYLFLVVLLFGVMILAEYIKYKQVTIDSEILELLFGLVFSIIMACKPAIEKGLEEYDEEWAKAFKWFYTPLIEKLVALFKKFINLKKN